jgi:hypothetical protein
VVRTIDDEVTATTLSRIELREAELLAWGIVDSALTEGELDGLLAQDLPPGTRVEDLKHELLDRLLVVRTPSGAYRTRMAETVRLLSKLRQLFPQQRWWEGTPLVLDYRFLHRPRRRPRRDRARGDALAALSSLFGDAGRKALGAVAPSFLSGFQERTVAAVTNALASGRDTGVMVAAGTGSGKTLAFYMPALAWLSDGIASDDTAAARCLTLYPRGELLRDQLRAVLMMTRSMAGTSSIRPVRVGTWFGPTPRAAFWLKQGWARDWEPRKVRGAIDGWICPFVSCLSCNGAMVWKLTDLDRGLERLTCADRQCGDVIDERFITLTRDRASSSPPDVMFTTTESLNRQLSAPDQHRAFGLSGTRARLVLLDEVHTYEGASGAQNALLARRLRHAIGRPLVWVGLSATLRNAESFFAQFAGLYGDQVTVTQPDVTELEEMGAEYLVALRHDPASGTGPLSTTIQTAMLLTRCLDAPGSPYEPAPTSNGTFGRKSFVFTDKLDVTNRLYWDLLDAEGWWQRARPKSRPVLTLAHLRSEEQTRRPTGQQEPPEEREAEGQWWWLPEQLGRDLSGDEQLIVGRTSSQDVGVDVSADVIVATATLEVGYDDPQVGVVLQHKAPHDAARFLQRKGRAGRDTSMRPWTAVVLGDWGRDRVAWELYDQLFDPEIEPRHLPLRNRYVLRMQSVYSTLDWLGSRLQSLGRDRSAWIDVVAPANVLETNPERKQARASRQQAMAELLKEVLAGGPAREHLRGHLRRALGFADDEQAWQEVDALLWGPPRPLLLSVLPTIHRRLRSGWAGEVPERDSHEVRTRTPLREFIAGNLFDDLLTPEVEVLVPTGARDESVEVELLPAMRTLRELMPGNVTRHFGVSSFSRRHWVALDADAGQTTIDIVDVYNAQFVSSFTSNRLPAGGVALYRPVGVTLTVPPRQIRDASSVVPSWEVHAEPIGDGREVTLGRDHWERVLGAIRIHAHATGDGARYRRYARGATGTLFAGGAPEPVSVTFSAGTDSGHTVALGSELDVDAIRFDVLVPLPPPEPSRLERSDRLSSLLTSDPSLPDALNWFQRTALVASLLVVLAELESPSPPLLDPLNDDDVGSRLIDGLQRLGLSNVVDPDAADVGGPAAEEGDLGHPDAHHDSMESWCRDPRVVAAVRRGASRAWSPRDADWVAWWRQRFAATVGAVFLEAIGRAAPDVDTTDLAIDIDPRGVAQAQGVVEVWLSETSPGGNGHVEQIHRVLLEDPKRFARLLDGVLEDNEYEQLDRDVRRFLELDITEPDIRTGCDAVRGAWDQGHTAVAQSFASLRTAIESADTELARTAWTTIVNRMLGPGAHSELLATVRHLIARWDALEETLGAELPTRVFGAICANDTSVDVALRLEGSSRYRRSRAVGSFFWPRGGAASRIQLDAGNAFGLLPAVDQSMLRESLGTGPRLIEVDAWDRDTERVIHKGLVDDGYVILKVAAAEVARAVSLQLQLQPIDVGALLAYPRVVGAWHREGSVHLAVVLDEAVA